MASALQTQFPLSPKKFWKKVIEKVVVILFLSLLVAFPVYFVVQSVKSSQSIGQGIFTAVLCGLVLFVIITCLYAIYVHYYIKTYYYSDDGDFLTIKKGVFAPTEIHVQYMKIQDVYVDQDILDRIMGLYDVHISSATYSSGMEAHIDGVEKSAADGLKELLLGKIKHSTSGQGMQGQSVSSGVTGSVGANVGAGTEPVKAHFSSPISSDVYGLSQSWWTSEIVKLVFGAIFSATIFSIWIYGGFVRRDSTEPWVYSNILWLWLGLLVIFVVYRTVYLVLWKNHYKYEFGEEYIYMKTGVLSVSEKNMGYNTVQDVRVNQSFIDRIFGVADLIIENAAQSMMVVPGRYGSKNVPVNNGVTIEGLSLADAKKIAEEMKKVVISKATRAKGV